MTHPPSHSDHHPCFAVDLSCVARRGHPPSPPRRWLALVLLASGVVLIDLHPGDSVAAAEGSLVLGLTAVLSACLTSGLAGVYLEKVRGLGAVEGTWVRSGRCVGCFRVFFFSFSCSSLVVWR